MEQIRVVMTVANLGKQWTPSPASTRVEKKEMARATKMVDKRELY